LNRNAIIGPGEFILKKLLNERGKYSKHILNEVIMNKFLLILYIMETLLVYTLKYVTQ